MTLSDKLGIGLELKDIMGCYMYSYSSKASCWAARSHLYLINDLPTSNKSFVADTILFKGDWRNTDSELTLVDRLPRSWKSPPSLGKPNVDKIIALLSYWGEDKENPNLEARSSHVVLNYTPPSSCKPADNRHIVWSLKEVNRALAGRNPKWEFYGDKEEKEDASEGIVEGMAKEVGKGVTERVTKKATKKVVSEDEEYVVPEDSVVPLPQEKPKKRSSVQPSTSSKRPKISFSRTLVDEPNSEAAPGVTQVVGDTLEGISDVVVSTKGTAEGAPRTRVVELDEVPSYDSLLAEIVSEGDREIPSVASHGKGKRPMLSPAIRQAMIGRDVSTGESTFEEDTDENVDDEGLDEPITGGSLLELENPLEAALKILGPHIAGDLERMARVDAWERANAVVKDGFKMLLQAASAVSGLGVIHNEQDAKIDKLRVQIGQYRKERSLKDAEMEKMKVENEILRVERDSALAREELALEKAKEAEVRHAREMTEAATRYMELRNKALMDYVRTSAQKTNDFARKAYDEGRVGAPFTIHHDLKTKTPTSSVAGSGSTSRR